jgi:hypothetical protein
MSCFVNSTYNTKKALKTSNKSAENLSEKPKRKKPAKNGLF